MSPFKRDRSGQKEGFSLSRLCAVIFQDIDVPLLVMCPSWLGSTSRASQNLVISKVGSHPD